MGIVAYKFCTPLVFNFSFRSTWRGGGEGGGMAPLCPT